jgi:N-methylhydantoinase A/oxoprolinase/acetone carboxylase beta subunit
MGLLINIDNGGTLTDFCALDGDRVYHTKSLTTPFDLSKCFFDGLLKLARDIYGDEKRVAEMLQSTDYIRYSTTQGTNALVQREGPMLGLLVEKGANLDVLKNTPAETALFQDLIGERVAEMDLSLTGQALEMNLVAAVNTVATNGASRIVLSVNEEKFSQLESGLCKIIGRKFPSHLLGVVPVLSAGELADDPDYGRRTWSSILNTFLHPTMERFLYSADYRLKTYKTRNPLLIFRNDGGAARVAKTTAIKSYSSGPRGGLEGVKALAEHYGFSKVVSYDVGGTTTDIGTVTNGLLTNDTHGHVEGVQVSFPLADINSFGVGGSSVIAAEDGVVTVGPNSVGAAPGPACFGLGGRRATITDVLLLMGMLDAETYFGGELDLDIDRAREAVLNNVAEPLGIDVSAALDRMLAAWVEKIVAGLKEHADIDGDSVLVGFGGAGALAATRIADMAGVSKVVIPGLGAVFSAAGIGFSPLSQNYRVNLSNPGDEELRAVLSSVHRRAEKDLYAEGVDISECEISAEILRIRDGDLEEVFTIGEDQGLPCELEDGDRAVLLFEARKRIQGLKFAEIGKEVACEPVIGGMRAIKTGPESTSEVAVIRLEEQQPGTTCHGPVIIEEAYFTGLVDDGWQMSISGNRDLVLEKVN